MLIENKRIYLREYTLADLKDFHDLVSDPDIRKLSILKTTHSRNESLAELTNIIEEQKNDKRKLYIFAVLLKTTDEYIGDCGFDILKQGEKGGIAEIGYFVKKKYWEQGYATEIGQSLIVYCFTHFNFHKIVACCDKRNDNSEKVMIKCGMKKEGELKQQRLKNNEWGDELRYALFRVDWVNLKYSMVSK